MELQIAVNHNHVGKHPPDKEGDEKEAWFRWFNGCFTNCALSTEDLADVIRRGQAIAPQHRRYRKAENFIAAQHVGIDLDDGSKTLTQVLEMPIVYQHAALVHTTASHTAEHPRLRVVFILDRPVTDPSKYILLVKSLLHYFGTADPMCKDACRLFYGAKDCQLVKLGNVLTLEDAAELFVNPYLAMEDQAAADRAEALQNLQIANSGDVPAAVLERHSQALLRRVQDAPNGQKYLTLRDIARVFGGYVAGGYYSEGNVCAWLRAAIETRRHDVKDMNHAYKTIDQWVRLGMADPLYFELRPQSSTGGRQSNILPRSTAWRVQAMRERYQELDALLTAGAATMDSETWQPLAQEYADLEHYLYQIDHAH